MQLPRFSIRSIMISIAFLALILTVIGQAVLLQRTTAREQQLRAELERQRAIAADREAQAINALRKFGDAVANEPVLKDSPELDGLRKRLLKGALPLFK